MIHHLPARIGRKDGAAKENADKDNARTCPTPEPPLVLGVVIQIASVEIVRCPAGAAPFVCPRRGWRIRRGCRCGRPTLG